MTGSSGRGHAEKARCLLFALSFPGGDLSCEFADGMGREKRGRRRGMMRGGGMEGGMEGCMEGGMEGGMEDRVPAGDYFQ